MARRKLAAIIFSDIIGYESLQESDEKMAFDIRKKNLRIHKKLIKKFNGRLLKEMGGAVLGSFNSNIEAVLCAIMIEKAVTELEISVRIGIHQGDVIFEKKDVLGDGVNISSRIQNELETKGIVISETVYNDIKNKEGINIDFLGDRKLKGKEKSVGIFIVTCSDYLKLDFSIETGELSKPGLTGRVSLIIGIIIITLISYIIFSIYFNNKNQYDVPDRSVLIFPFENLLGSDSLEYLAAGMHDALIGNIGRLSDVNVKSRTTAKAVTKSSKSIPEIANELGVNVVITGELLCSGDSICLRLQIPNIDEGQEPLWTKEYYEDRSEILKLYNTITKEISDEINVKLKPKDEQFLEEYRLLDPDAYDAYLRGRFSLDKVTPESLYRAIEEFNYAIEIDPDWAAPYAGIAEAGGYLRQLGVNTPDNMVLIYKNLNKAFELDPNSFYYHYTNAIIAVWTEYDWEKADREFQIALELYPSHVRNRSFYAHLLQILRKTDEAVYQANKAQELDPLNPLTFGLSVAVLVDAGRCEEALAKVDTLLTTQPDHPFRYSGLRSIYICLGDYEKAFENWKMMNYELWEEYGVTELYEKAFREKGWIGVHKEAIRINEEFYAKDGKVHLKSQGDRYILIGEYERAMDYFEKMYEENIRDPNLPYISTKSTYDVMKDNIRYIELLRKLNLPID
jgi:adenylate cyclase